MCESESDKLICNFDYVRNNIVKFSISEINDYSRVRLINLLGRLSNEIYVIYKIERKNKEIQIHFIKIKPKEQTIQRLVDEYSLIAIPKEYYKDSKKYEVYTEGEGLNYELLKGGEKTIETMVQRGRGSRR
jgi:hypothetical protein